MTRQSRREFLKTAAAGGLAAASSRTVLASTTQAQAVSPNDRIQLALIGAGGQGMGDTRTALRVPGVELVAVADVYDGRLTRSRRSGEARSSPRATTARSCRGLTSTPSSSPPPTTGISGSPSRR
jgi:hypothetical protein